MSKVDGVPYRTADQLAEVGPIRARAIAEHMIGTLAVLHAVPPAEVGLADFGRPEGFLARQVRRWKQQLDASRSRPLAGIDELHALLAADPPDGSPPAIVHGDYRLDNVLVDADDKVAAVVDWEMATLGDPLTDVGLLVVYQQMDRLGDGPMASAAPGYPSVPEVLALYAARSGRDLSDLGFYIALASFKAAVILEGIHFRYVHGQTVGEGFEQIGTMVEPLVAAGLAAMQGKDN
jgi:aminoglycoside phosphotransferase (APT) family kinase protein